MTYTIAICDDDPMQVKIVENYIIIAEENCENLLERIKHHNVDVFFLDIQMNHINGIDISIEIKKQYTDSVIVFITGFEKYAIKAFEIRAFNYIMKPLTYNKFKTTFDEVCTVVEDIKYRKSMEDEIIVSNKLGINKIKYKDIFYFEKSLRKIKIVCKNKSVEYYSSFKDLKNNINMSFFTQCHQSFIVNNDKISSYEKQNIYIEELNFYIPVSRVYIDVVKNTLAENLFK